MTEMLFDPATLARRSDPWTSKSAAQRINPHSRIHALLKVYGDAMGHTAEEAALRAGMTHLDEPWKRVSDLLRLELVKDTGETRPALSGRHQRVLRITDLGRRTLAGLG